MGKLNKPWSQEDINAISYELAIARAKVYKKWGFDMSEIATLVDLPEDTVRAELSKEE